MSTEKDLNYWKANAEEDYKQVPISVIRYITELETAVKNCSIPVVMPSLEDARIAKEKYMEKKNINGYNTYLTGVGSHFQDGVNWALNKIKKLN